MADRARDSNYRQWVEAHERGLADGNPPLCRLLDVAIDQAAREYPEHSALDREQAQIDADARANWNG